MLFDGREQLDDATWAAIVALGSSVVPALIQNLVDPALAQTDATLHAADILAAIGAPEAIPPMISVFLETDFDELLHDRIRELGELTPAHERKLEQAESTRRAYANRVAADRTANAPSRPKMSEALISRACPGPMLSSSSATSIDW